MELRFTIGKLETTENKTADKGDYYNPVSCNNVTLQQQQQIIKNIE